MMLKRKASRGFTLIELMVVIVIIGILVAIALPNFIGAQDRAKISSVKANMHTFQTMIETYGVDWGGQYPNTYASIQSEAIARDYTKNYANPFTGQTLSLQNNTNCLRLAEVVTGGGGTPSSYIDNSAYGGPGGAACVGQVIYRRSVVASNYGLYAIYGLDKTAIWIKDKGKVFELTNG